MNEKLSDGVGALHNSGAFKTVKNDGKKVKEGVPTSQAQAPARLRRLSRENRESHPARGLPAFPRGTGASLIITLNVGNALVQLEIKDASVSRRDHRCCFSRSQDHLPRKTQTFTRSSYYCKALNGMKARSKAALLLKRSPASTPRKAPTRSTTHCRTLQMPSTHRNPTSEQLRSHRRSSQYREAATLLEPKICS